MEVLKVCLFIIFIGCIDVTSFDWFSQLKFFWDTGKDDCLIRQTNTQFFYTYEYIGNSGRLVITPLTDRFVKYVYNFFYLIMFRGLSYKLLKNCLYLL